ncbi:unnamed protein product [Vitrella brassicaformis CCMP3155]|uniref:Uncharacterized protein n=1 Tax=Vitrella brassicaformis (strain CCMP3155) TaxID=1169540 RepID=A0A0G4G099_VITBC|nr:unnamed protein product [Vitrella brassicaformis CCMP3155]|eukprot:CEM20952.1 unnamed protein product [Vitrella brassicaformis CCMP3155]
MMAREAAAQTAAAKAPSDKRDYLATLIGDAQLPGVDGHLHTFVSADDVQRLVAVCKHRNELLSNAYVRTRITNFIQTNNLDNIVQFQEPSVSASTRRINGESRKRSKLLMILYLLENGGRFAGWEGVLVYAKTCGRLKTLPIPIGDAVCSIKKAVFDSRAESIRDWMIISQQFQGKREVTLSRSKCGLPGAEKYYREMMGKQCMSVFGHAILYDPAGHARPDAILYDQVHGGHEMGVAELEELYDEAAYQEGNYPLVPHPFADFDLADPPIALNGDTYRSIRDAVVKCLQGKLLAHEVNGVGHLGVPGSPRLLRTVQLCSQSPDEALWGRTRVMSTMGDDVTFRTITLSGDQPGDPFICYLEVVDLTKAPNPGDRGTIACLYTTEAQQADDEQPAEVKFPLTIQLVRNTLGQHDAHLLLNL